MRRFVDSGGVRLCVDTVGDPAHPAILMIGGMSSSLDWWPDELCERLAAGLRYVIRYDHRDTGESTHYPAGKPGYTGMDLVADVPRVLDGLGLTAPAHLVGISMGGVLAMLTAATYPDRVASLTLVSTSTHAPGLPGASPEISAHFANAPEVDWSDPAAAVDAIVAYDRLLAGPDAFDAAASRALATRVVARTADVEASQVNHLAADTGDDGRPLHERVAGIAVPTLVVHGTADPMLPYPHAEATAAAFAGAELLPLPGVGHQVPPPSTWDVLVPAMLRLTSESWDAQADRLAARAIAAGAPYSWFDRLYAAGAAGEVDMPWDRSRPNQMLVDWASAREHTGGRAVLVGAGLGVDAEYVASLGYDTTAFDVAPTAVELARTRHPESTVDYRVADLLDLPADLVGGFDLVVEIYTVQALPVDYRQAAVTGVASLVAAGGTLFVLAFRTDSDGERSGPPWPLTRAELDSFTATGLSAVRIDKVQAARPYWKAEFTRTAPHRPDRTT
jgi:pimeloyl-ACP methyl ester carboxylesterase/2-polyprenyl-3-methyl-5-hydroxy-6-metoxy-1,4-benzoquinol methylase